MVLAEGSKTWRDLSKVRARTLSFSQPFGSSANALSMLSQDVARMLLKRRMKYLAEPGDRNPRLSTRS